MRPWSSRQYLLPKLALQQYSNSRTLVLAAANPIAGRYDDLKVGKHVFVDSISIHLFKV
jgi:hypothetical protein